MFWELMLASGVCWTAVYILIIRRGFKDGAYGMPVAALCANLSWEFIFSFVHPHDNIQRNVNFVWLAFDMVILWQTLRLGPNQNPNIGKAGFFAQFALTLATAFCLVLFLTYELKDDNGIYAAFAQNLMMSILFIDFLQRRGSARGQSLYIALFKMVGTLFASAAIWLYAPVSKTSVLLPFLYVAIAVFDGIYLALLYRTLRAQGEATWRRL
jgi:hypothetical protein